MKNAIKRAWKLPITGFRSCMRRTNAHPVRGFVHFLVQKLNSRVGENHLETLLDESADLLRAHL